MTIPPPSFDGALPGPVGIVGLGRAGVAIARSLLARGVPLAGACSRSPRGRRDAEALGLALHTRDSLAARAGLLVLAVPDDALPEVVRSLATATHPEGPRHLIHLSARVAPSVLAPAAGPDDLICAVHPLQTLPDDAPADVLVGAVAAIGADGPEARALGHTLATTLGLVPFDLADEARPLYHAAAVFAANFSVTLLGTAHALAQAAGMPPELILRGLGTLARNAVDAATERGAATALTGPVARGDAGTVRAHLETLDRAHPEAAALYRPLTRATIALAGTRGALSAEATARLTAALEPPGPPS